MTQVTPILTNMYIIHNNAHMGPKYTALPLLSDTMARVRSRGSPADEPKALESYRARHARAYGRRALHERTRAKQEMASALGLRGWDGP